VRSAAWEILETDAHRPLGGQPYGETRCLLSDHPRSRNISQLRLTGESPLIVALGDVRASLMKAGCYQVASCLLGVFPALDRRTAGAPQGRCEIANEYQSLTVLMGHVSVRGVASGYPVVYDEHAYPFVPSMNLVIVLLEYTRKH
jgi:hypothetical protein